MDYARGGHRRCHWNGGRWMIPAAECTGRDGRVGGGAPFQVVCVFAEDVCLRVRHCLALHVLRQEYIRDVVVCFTVSVLGTKSCFPPPARG